MTKLVTIDDNIYDINDIAYTTDDTTHNDLKYIQFKSGTSVMVSHETFTKLVAIINRPSVTGGENDQSSRPGREADTVITKDQIKHRWYTHDSDFAPVYDGEDLHLYFDVSGSLIDDVNQMIVPVLRDYIQIARCLGCKLFVNQFSHYLGKDYEIKVDSDESIDALINDYIKNGYEEISGGTDQTLVYNHINDKLFRKNDEFSIIITDYQLFVDKNVPFPNQVFFEAYPNLNDPMMPKFKQAFINAMEKMYDLEGFEFHCDDT